MSLLLVRDLTTLALMGAAIAVTFLGIRLTRRS